MVIVRGVVRVMVKSVVRVIWNMSPPGRRASRNTQVK